jgi:predicted RNase H-related nuclease YkuK (DUF458 family)
MDMNKVFKKINGEVVDIVKHTLSILNEYPTVDIHIGTDSQNHRNHTFYSTVIAYRFGTRGVHYIVHKQKVKKIKDKWTRLWNETEYTIETAEFLSKKLNVKIQLDFDYNEDENHFSSKLINSARGWANSLGYKVNVKPHNQIATRAADYQCR